MSIQGCMSHLIWIKPMTLWAKVTETQHKHMATRHANHMQTCKQGTLPHLRPVNHPRAQPMASTRLHTHLHSETSTVRLTPDRRGGEERRGEERRMLAVLLLPALLPGEERRRGEEMLAVLLLPALLPGEEERRGEERRC